TASRTGGRRRPSFSAAWRIARKIRFSSGVLGRFELPVTPLLRADVRAPGRASAVARTRRNSSSASPRQSNPAPRFAVEAGTRISNEVCSMGVIFLDGGSTLKLHDAFQARYRRLSRMAALLAGTRRGSLRNAPEIA